MITKHTAGIYIILVLIVLGQLPAIALASLGLPAFAIVMLVGSVGYTVYVLRQSDTRIKTALSLFPVFTAGLGLLSSLAGSQASIFHWLILGGMGSLFWFIVISIYTAKSKAYQQRYKPVEHETVMGQNKPDDTVSNTTIQATTPVLNPVSNINTEEQSSLQIENKSDKENNQEEYPAWLFMVVLGILCAFAFVLVTDI